MNARECPTDAELERGLQNSLSRSSSEGEPFMGTSTLPSRTSSSGRLSSTLSKVESTIIDEICRQRAESASVYANPSGLSGYEFWGEYKYDVGRKETIEDCWYYQLAYWVIEDVIDTIGAMNSGSNSVLTSPVKRLLRVGFTTSEGTYRDYGRSGMVGETAQAADVDRPSYVLSIGQGTYRTLHGKVLQ